MLGDRGPGFGPGRFRKQGMTPARMGGSGMIDLHGVTIALTDGHRFRTAAVASIDDLVVFDLALDWCAATHLAVAPAPPLGRRAEPRRLFFQALGLAVSVFADVPGLAVMRTVAMPAT